MQVNQIRLEMIPHNNFGFGSLEFLDVFVIVASPPVNIFFIIILFIASDVNTYLSYYHSKLKESIFVLVYVCIIDSTITINNK